MKREKKAGIWKGEMSGSLDQATEAQKAISGGVANPQTTKSWKPSVPEKISAARCACACAIVHLMIEVMLKITNTTVCLLYQY